MIKSVTMIYRIGGRVVEHNEAQIACSSLKDLAVRGKGDRAISVHIKTPGLTKEEWDDIIEMEKRMAADDRTIRITRI